MLVVAILLMFAVAQSRNVVAVLPQSKQQSKHKPQPAPVAVDDSASLKIMADMNSTITDVRGANGTIHGAGAPDCPHPTARSNLLNSHDRNVLRETGQYGEVILSQERDHVDGRAISCSAPRANDTVRCVRELVDEAAPVLSPKEQLEEDRHLLLDYILPVDVQY